MSATVAIDTQDLAMELHALLREIDPARWRRERRGAHEARALVRLLCHGCRAARSLLSSG